MFRTRQIHTNGDLQDKVIVTDSLIPKNTRNHLRRCERKGHTNQNQVLSKSRLKFLD